MITLEDVRGAAGRLAPHIHRTPVLSSGSLDRLLDRELLFKGEHLQKTGSFKVRGALNAALQLGAPRGLVTLSSGNHAQGVAFSSRVLGVPCVVVMYEDASETKKAAVRSYGATVVDEGVTRLNGEARVQAIAAERGFHYIHAYDDAHVMAGQGTQALEFTEQADAPDAVLVAVGGGGMISGIATVIKAVWPGTRVIGVEPEAADDTRRSLLAGRRIRLDAPPRTVADGVQTMMPGALTFPVVQRSVDEVLAVREESILEAQRLMMRHLKQVVEPTAGLTLAPLLEGAELPRRLGLFVCGGNWLP